MEFCSVVIQFTHLRASIVPKISFRRAQKSWSDFDVESMTLGSSLELWVLYFANLQPCTELSLSTDFQGIDH